jgi:hypothetical protein
MHIGTTTTGLPSAILICLCEYVCGKERQRQEKNEIFFLIVGNIKADFPFFSNKTSTGKKLGIPSDFVH